MRPYNIRSAATIVTLTFALAACSKDESPSTAMAASTPSSAALASNASEASAHNIKVYKDPNCGCCIKWVEHLQANGFVVETMDMPDLSLIKQKYMIGDNLQSCHTAIVGDYAIEGHVPADVILQMLKEKPAIAGLAVPGMPMGSPGMEGPTKEKYDILTFDRAGRTSVYAQR